MKILICWLVANLLIVWVNIALGQSTINGQVVDSTNNPLPLAHLLIFQADGIFLKGVVADTIGKFEVSDHFEGKLYVKVQALGFTDFVTDSFPANQTMQLGTIVLQTSSEALDEVVVMAQKPLFEQEIDRTIVNVQSSVTNMGNNVLSILSKSPAVRINRTTNEISMMNKSGVLVMIDNKQVRMEAEELINLLESMSANNIATIELITAPPANYDAQGNAGIININTIRKREGISGQFSVNAAYGKRPKFGGSLNFSYQKGKFYTYTNLSSNVAYDLEKVSIYTGSSSLATTSDLKVVRKPRTGLYSGEIGVDYQLTPKTTVGGIFTALSSDWKMQSVANTDSYEGSERTLTQTRSYEENLLFQTLLNLNIGHRFSEHTEISLDLDRIQFKRKNPTDYQVSNLENTSADRFFSNATTPVTVQVIKSDLKQQLTDALQIEAGIKGTFSDFSNQVRVAFDEGGTLIDDPTFTDDFKMSEEIYAAYISTDWAVSPKLNAKAGLRYEYYSLDLSSKNLEQISSRHQGNLFPSAHLSYQLASQQELGLSYVNRIQRPGFLMLAPYFYFFDQNTLFTGNPTLIPSRSNQVQLSFNGNNITFSVQYSRERLPVLDLQPTLDDELGTFIIRPIQGNANQIFSANAIYSVEVANWWTGRFNFLASHLFQDLTIQDVNYSKSSFNFEVTTTQNWHIRDIVELELVAGYYSPFYSGALKMLARSQVNLGVRKKLKSGASFSLNVNDLFNTGSQWPMRSDLLSTGMDYRFNFDAEGPIFRVNFSMPLGNKSLKVREQRDSGAEEEQNRLN